MKKYIVCNCICEPDLLQFLAHEAQPKEQEPQTPLRSSGPRAQNNKSQDQDKGQAIATSELPANIQAALQGQDYSGWTVASAFKKKKMARLFIAFN